MHTSQDVEAHLCQSELINLILVLSILGAERTMPVEEGGLLHQCPNTHTHSVTHTHTHTIHIKANNATPLYQVTLFLNW